LRALAHTNKTDTSLNIVTQFGMAVDQGDVTFVEAPIPSTSDERTYRIGSFWDKPPNQLSKREKTTQLWHGRNDEKWRKVKKRRSGREDHCRGRRHREAMRQQAKVVNGSLIGDIWRTCTSCMKTQPLRAAYLRMRCGAVYLQCLICCAAHGDDQWHALPSSEEQSDGGRMSRSHHRRPVRPSTSSTPSQSSAVQERDGERNVAGETICRQSQP